MGLYLCVFDDNNEIDGVEVGSYDDFGVFRDFVRDLLEGGTPGARFPVLMKHSDCDGAWSPEEAAALRTELATISEEFTKHPPAPARGWQRSVMHTYGLVPKNLFECFIDVDGEPLLDRIQGLCERAVHLQRPILFQ